MRRLSQTLENAPTSKHQAKVSSHEVDLLEEKALLPANSQYEDDGEREEEKTSPEALSDTTSTSEDDDDAHKKSVRWSTVTVYEFGVAMGGSAIPRRGGPSIGLARRPQHVWSARVDDVEEGDEEEEDDDAWLRDLKLGRSACSHRSAVQTSVARRRRVRWLKPLERVELLTSAGCSEKRIYRMMMESSEIAMSRRLCASVLRDVEAV